MQCCFLITRYCTGLPYSATEDVVPHFAKLLRAYFRYLSYGTQDLSYIMPKSSTSNYMANQAGMRMTHTMATRSKDGRHFAEVDL